MAKTYKKKDLDRIDGCIGMYQLLPEAIILSAELTRGLAIALDDSERRREWRDVIVAWGRLSAIMEAIVEVDDMNGGDLGQPMQESFKAGVNALIEQSVECEEGEPARPCFMMPGNDWA